MYGKILIVEDELIVARDLEALLIEAGYEVVGIARTVRDALIIIDRTNVQLVLLDIYLDGTQTGIDLAEKLNEKNIAFVYLSANSNQQALEAAEKTRPYGFMVKPFREKDVLVSLEIAKYRHQNSIDAQVRQDILVQEQLGHICTAPANFDQKLLEMTKVLQPFLPFDFIEIGRTDTSAGRECWRGFLRIGFDEYQSIGKTELTNMTGIREAALLATWEEGEREVVAKIYNNTAFINELRRNPAKLLYANLFHLHSQLSLPLFIDHGTPFYLGFYSKSAIAFDNRMLQFVGRMQQALSSVLTELVGGQANVVNAGPAISADPVFCGFPGIIGNSQALLAALDFVKQVGVVDTSVLILGETGTGKEKIAEHIHQLSARRNGPLVKVNCAALPVSLIESELFGHEKGAFTGATGRRIGRFEQASGGTIFLDEIGDVPPDIQVKLLRVLQEREFERIGGKETIKVDVRVIAATNKNLEQEIAEGRFRMDLYYRLNVFPVWMPPLRQRVEDIPLLAAHFIKVYNAKHHKEVTVISPEAIAQLMQYEWPGNIRELENSIERSLVLAKGNEIEHVFIKAPFAAQPSAPTSNAGIKTIEEVERDHILVVLNRCNNKIYGSGGAAEMLNIPPTTLASKIKRLGITRS